MAEKVDLRDFVTGFIAEAEEHLASANRNLLAADEALKKGQTPARQVRELFRALHTVKGLAAMVGVEPIVELAHELETLLREADRSGGQLPREAIDLMLRGIRAVEARVRALERGDTVPPADPRLLKTLQALREGAPAAPPAVAAPSVALPPDLDTRLSDAERAHVAEALGAGLALYLVDFVPSATRVEAGISITSVREALSASEEVIKVVPRSPSAAPGGRTGISFALIVASAKTGAAIAEIARLTESEVTRVAEPGPERAQAAAATGPAAEVEAGAALPGPDAEEVGDTEGGGKRSLVRVDVSRLDDALEDLSALVVIRHRLKLASHTLAARGADVRELNAILQDHARQLRALRASIMSARTVPVADVLDRVPLMVRGLSRTLGKPARLELRLGAVEVDKAVGDRIFPAIVHLIRNAMDHGLEGPDERRRAGKPEEGTLRVTARDESSTYLEIRVEDDGRGIDAAAVAAKADAPVPKDTAALLELITRPGLSTRAEANQTSGRGMGMDIVRRVATDLGGALLLETTPGAGTAFTVRVPLSITIIDAFTFQAGPQAYAVPVSMIDEIIEVDPAQVVRPPAPSGVDRGRLIHRRGEPLVLLNLGELFAIDGAEAPKKALIVRQRGAGFAFGVSRMLGQQEIVVRPLEDPLVKVPGISGATDLGDGRATLVLDLLALSGQRRDADGGRAHGAGARS